MAPPNMFSYFKNHHKRAGSTPNSPRSPQWQAQNRPSPTGSDQLKSPPTHSPAQPSPLHEASPISPLPPSLPPIPRVASRHESEPHESRSHQATRPDVGSPLGSKDPKLSSPPPMLPPIQGIPNRRQPDMEPLKIDTKEAVEAALPEQRQPPPRIELRQSDSPSSTDELPTSGYRLFDMNQHSRNTSTNNPSSASRHFASRPLTPTKRSPKNDQLQPPVGSSKRASSPSSSLSSAQPSLASSTVDTEPSPASSRSAQHSHAAPSKSSKPRLNLLNPVSLLRRRRTAQNVEHISESSAINNSGLGAPALNLPEDYDPRIKGKGVHDFNNPQPRRNYSTNDMESLSSRTVGEASPVEEYHRRSSAADQSPDNDALEIPSKQKQEGTERHHHPVFVEHIEEDGDHTNQASSAVQRESLADASFLARISRRLDFESWESTSHEGSSAPSKPQETHKAGERVSKSTNGATSLRYSSDQSTLESSFSQDTRATSPPASSSAKQDHAPSDGPLHPSALPKHLSSTASRASRFSFQFNTDGTDAEEKALEEKGKRKAAALEETSDQARDERYDDIDDEGMDAFDDFDDGGYEEEIPMVGGDDGFYNQDPSAQVNVVPSDETTWNSSSSSQPTITATTENKERQKQKDESPRPGRNATVKSSGSGGWYFDDGNFNEPSPNGGSNFDEAIFDSPSDDKFKRQTLDEAISNQHRSGEVDTTSGQISEETQEATSGVSEDAQDSLPIHQPQPTKNRLSMQNLETLNNTLATFQRQPSVASVVGSDLGWYGAFNQSAFDEGNAGFDEDVDYDALEDDPMVAAANAEILESDEADHYGQEFGFWGASHSQGQAVLNGGVFRSEVSRSKSGRVVCREPSLTPITERSEHSRRTSHVSLPRLGSSYSGPGSAGPPGSAHILPSPGLRDIAADIVAEDGNEMRLDQLMQQRKSTFGVGAGSDVSTSPSMGSPMMQNFSLPPTMEEMPPGYPESYHGQSNGVDRRTSDEPRDFGHELERHFSPASISPVESSPRHSLAVDTPDQSKDLTPRPWHTRPDVTASGSPTPKARRSMASTEASSPSPHTDSPSSPPQCSLPSNLPALPAHLLRKFASRPPASSATYAERERNSWQQLNGVVPVGRTITSYEDDPETGRTYLVRYKRGSEGELMFLGRELSTEGSAPFD